VKKLIEAIVTGLVDHPDEVEVDESPGGRRVVYSVRVHPEDRGQVIGKGGSTAEALRTLVGGIAQRRGLRVEIEIVD
jgi:predicted RNA-binding protein YlqC (UPF0109 family)